MDRGDLVPDDLICEVIMERLDSGEADDGFLLDGFPRTIGQAEMLERRSTSRGRELTAALLIDAPDDEVIRRLSGPPHLREEPATSTTWSSTRRSTRASATRTARG